MATALAMAMRLPTDMATAGRQVWGRGRAVSHSIGKIRAQEAVSLPTGGLFFPGAALTATPSGMTLRVAAYPVCFSSLVVRLDYGDMNKRQ